jgi:hypothetical protein
MLWALLTKVWRSGCGLGYFDEAIPLAFDIK